MKLFRRTPVEDPRDTRIRYLEEENEALVASAKVLADSQQDRINDLIDQKHRLRTKVDYAEKVITRLQAQLLTRQLERDKAIAEVKRLDAELVKAAT